MSAVLLVYVLVIVDGFRGAFNTLWDTVFSTFWGLLVSCMAALATWIYELGAVTLFAKQAVSKDGRRKQVSLKFMSEVSTLSTGVPRPVWS